ncbi:hypothetical protein Tco_0922261 [Tanacetum coccineum]|uniref:Uncharacterized protein n=1 Tax=Tanacetum coccineum TaxID=301880 RepID=A0ABQ5CZ44_9ASTR
MHTTMVPEQVKTQNIQAGVQVSRLEDKDVIFSTGSTLEVFILFIFALDRNIVIVRYIQRISLTGFPAQSVGSSSTNVLDLPCLLVLITGMSQSRQHESCKSPTVELFEVDSGRISIRHYEY